MFNKFRDKLKKTLSIFSKKTEEEAEEKEVVVEKVVEQKAEEPIKELKVKREEVEQKKEKKEAVKKEITKVEKEIKHEKEIKPKEVKEPKKEIINEEIIELPKEEKEEKEEKKGFFGKLFRKKEELEELKEKEAEEEIAIPEKFDVAKQKFEPDLEKIKEIGKKIKVEEERKVVRKGIVSEHEPDTSLLLVKEALEETSKSPKERAREAAEEFRELYQEDVEKPEEEKRSFFQKLKQTITTKTISEEKFDELFWELEIALMENNVSIEVIERIKQDLKKELVEKPLPRDVSAKIEETLKQTLTEILSVDSFDLLERIRQKEKKPYIIAFFGINGAGKTTAIAKLSYLFQQKGLKTVLAAGDTFRAAAIQQLEEHAVKLGTKIIKQDYGSDAAAVAFDAVKYAQKNEIDVVLIDTAGRLHSNTNLMEELKKIVKVAKPDLKIFVGEAITGNDCIEQAKAFQGMVEIDAAILTKVDVDEKGGAPLSISYTIKKPILYLGVGQEYEDLEEFNVSVMLKRLGF